MAKRAKRSKRKQQAPQSEPSDQQEQGSRNEIGPDSSAIDDRVDFQGTTAGDTVAPEDQEDLGEPQREVTQAFERFERIRTHFREARTELQHAKRHHEQVQAVLYYTQQQVSDAREWKRCATRVLKVEVQHIRHAKELLHTARKNLRHARKAKQERKQVWDILARKPWLSSPEPTVAYPQSDPVLASLDERLADWQQQYGDLFPHRPLPSPLPHRGST
ncbi:MAG: hypothetical protein Q9184_005451, partial [Pyrenodesmia sp. 2 TL-2023]